MTFFGSKIFWSLPNVVKRTLVSQSFDYILAHIKMTCIGRTLMSSRRLAVPPPSRLTENVAGSVNAEPAESTDGAS